MTMATGATMITRTQDENSCREITPFAEVQDARTKTFAGDRLKLFGMPRKEL